MRSTSRERHAFGAACWLGSRRRRLSCRGICSRIGRSARIWRGQTKWRWSLSLKGRSKRGWNLNIAIWSATARAGSRCASRLVRQADGRRFSSCIWRRQSKFDRFGQGGWAEWASRFRRKRRVYEGEIVLSNRQRGFAVVHAGAHAGIPPGGSGVGS